MATTATALVLATSAFSAGHTAPFAELQFDNMINVNASDLIGARVYASEADIANKPLPENGEKEWDDIGDINEIVLTRSGDVTSVIVGVGGFLGLGEKDVAIDMSQLQFISDGEDADEFFLVVKASVAGVQDAPSFERATQASVMEMRTRLDAPAVTKTGYDIMDMEQLTAEMLTGARVYGSGDEDVGEVSELLLASDGTLDRVIIDVGGWLGMGEKPVAVSLDELTILRRDGDVRVYIDSTQESLEAQPTYEG